MNDAPNSFDISVTRKCNLRCKYCFYNDEMQERNDVPLDEWAQFFKEIGSLGVEDLTLSGGEFFVRKDWLQILDLAIENKMRFSILSNGTLIDEKTINLFNQHNRKRRLDYIQISIDGSCAEVHDKSRGKGSFEKAVRGLKLLKKNNFPVAVRVTINKHNVDDLDNIARFLLEEIGLRMFGTNDAMPMGAGCFNQEDVVLSPPQQYKAILKMGELDKKYPGRLQAQAGPLAKWNGYREMEESLKQEKPLNSRMGFLTACGCIYNKLSVHHDGIITPCNMLADLEMGRINRDNIKDIWNKHPILIMLKERRLIPMSEVPGCEGCKWQKYCNGSCPGLAYELTGEVNRANPHDCYRKFIEEVGHGIEI
ncbi:MAG: hypothetical protein APR63_10550 [Desulfuromonas sp. SDB]|nr:MAG: hypothetical protein APR63_10550 [Desulfuromonas sp. SDB]